MRKIKLGDHKFLFTGNTPSFWEKLHSKAATRQRIVPFTTNRATIEMCESRKINRMRPVGWCVFEWVSHVSDILARTSRTCMDTNQCHRTCCEHTQCTFRIVPVFCVSEWTMQGILSRSKHYVRDTPVVMLTCRIVIENVFTPKAKVYETMSTSCTFPQCGVAR